MSARAPLKVELFAAKLYLQAATCNSPSCDDKIKIEIMPDYMEQRKFQFALDFGSIGAYMGFPSVALCLD